jgi:hypothetical protein
VAGITQKAVVLAAIAMTFAIVSPVRAVTCEDVRSLSRAEQEYWAKRLHLTAEQRSQIWHACYGNDQHRRPKLLSVNSQ